MVLADRDGFYLQRLKRCLERRGDMTVVGMADNGVALLDLVIQKKPAVLLTDILLGERDGLWVLENIKKTISQLGMEGSRSCSSSISIKGVSW